MPPREEASMGTTEFKAYARRRKVKKEGPSENNPILQDQPADCSGLKRGHCATNDEPANRLLRLELDVAEALADFWRMAHRPSQQQEVLRWSCKRKRTAASLNKDSMVLSMLPKEEPEDALSTVKKNRSACTVGRDSSTSDRDEIESTRCSKESSSIFESRAQSPSSPLPSLQLPCGPFLTSGSPDAKSAFQRVLPLAPCLVTVKTEIEDMHSERLALGHRQVSVRPKSKACKSMVSKAVVKMEPEGEHGSACPEELGVKSVAEEKHKAAGPVSFNKTKSTISEKEKEARRLRRIQANRESARQTIRKKQVLCEDLTKKVSRLALENESMKQKRDSLLQELFSLKGQNHHLKGQLEKRSSGNLGHHSVESPPKMSSDSASIPVLQAPSLPYAGVPPPAFIWAMAAAAAAAAANQAYTLNIQEMWDPSYALQHQKGAFVLPSMPPCKQTSVPEAIEQNINCAGSGNSSPTLTDLPQKERDTSVRVCAKSSALEAQCDDSSHAHPAMEYASRDLSGKSTCDFSTQAGCHLPQPSAASKPELNSLPGTAATSKSMECITGWQMAQGAACGFSYGGSVVGFLEGKPQAQTMKGYAAMVAAEARRRRKELTRNKFARARAMRPAVVS